MLKQESADAVVLAPETPATASVIWLHGLGADGNDFVPIVPELRLPPNPAVRFVFPHAPMRVVTINNGMRMRAWYDIRELSASGAADEVGIRDSAAILARYIEREREAGVAANRIVIAGFSQGGAIALHHALRHPERLAGVMALSTYLPLRTSLAAEATAANRDLPILMCHGRFDPVLPMQLGISSRDLLRAEGYAVDWKEYPMQHQVCLEEVQDISAWLKVRLGAGSQVAGSQSGFAAGGGMVLHQVSNGTFASTKAPCYFTDAGNPSRRGFVTDPGSGDRKAWRSAP